MTPIERVSLEVGPPRIRDHKSRENRDQGRFACTVLADNGMDLT